MKAMFTKEEIMRRCLELARKGAGSVSPNPMVGCVIVKRGKVIGEGYHERFGGAHAEVNAIRSASESVQGAEIFVNLEPCSFFGKTPPCVDLLIEKKVGKVHVAMLDPNPRVNGKGVRKLRRAGIAVDVGTLSNEAGMLNEAFVKYIKTGLPFVTLKAAQSLDGKIALANGKSKYITSGDSLKMVHLLRSQHDAVLVGAGTVAADNPSLTVRLARGRSPVRIVLDGNLTSPLSSRIFHDRKSRVVLFHSAGAVRNSAKKLAVLGKLGIETYGLPGSDDGKIKARILLKSISKLGITSLLVEGGSCVFSQFIRSGEVDKLHLFTAPVIMGNGIGLADHINLNDLKRMKRVRIVSIKEVGRDQLLTGYFKF